MDKRKQQVVLVLLVAALGVLFALNSVRYFVRLDMSRNRAFSVSSATKDVLRKLEERVNITYYVSDKLRARYPFPGQVEDMLQEYAAFSRGRLVVSSVEPSKSKNTAQIESLGVVPQQMQDVVKDEINVATVYSGIVIQYLDRWETLPFVSDLSTLEFDLTSRIRKTVTNQKKGLGLLVGNAGKTLEKDYSLLQQQLREEFEIQSVEKGKDVPADVTVLLVLGNKDLEEPDVFPIDQFVMRGGKAVFCVDAVDVDVNYNLNATPVTNTALFDMLAGFGVRVRPELALDTVNQRIQISTGPNRVGIYPYPFWITVSEKNVNKNHPITSRFAGLDVYWASPLEMLQVPGVKEETLASTSQDSWTVKDNYQLNPQLSSLLSADSTTVRKSEPLVVALSGRFPSLFKGRPIPARRGEKPLWTSTVEGSPDTRLIVIGDSDLASGLLQYTNAGYNLAFIANCAQWLTSDEDLLAIKTRAQTDLRLNRIQDPAAKAGAILASQAINLAVVPGIVVVVGIFRLLMRRRRSKGVQQ